MSNFSSTYPSVSPTYQIDFSNGKRIPPNATFSRSDSPIDASKAAASAVHFWSNEKHISSDNLLLQSSDFDTSWTLTGINGTPTGGQADPAGGTDGFTLVEDTQTTFHQFYQDITASGELALTIYAKQKSGTRYLMSRFYNASGDWTVAVFDLAGGTPITFNSASSTRTSVSATQTASGGGFYKCTLKATGSSVAAAIALKNSYDTSGLSSSSGAASYTGDGTSSIDVAFASLSTTGATDYNSTSGSIHREYAPTLKSVATAGAARFEYEPAGDRESRGLLVEGQAQNLVTYSNDSTQWSSVNVNLTAASGVAPSGVLEANLCVPSAATDFHWWYVNAPNFTSGTAYTQSVYVKAAGANYIQLSYSGSAFPTVHCNFDLANGTVGSSSGMTGAIQSVGNGWHRISATVTATSSATAIPFISHITSSTDGRRPSTVGDGYSGYLVYGYQVEANSHASSFISSDSGSATTRAADSLSVATADIGYTGGPVTIVGEIDGVQGNYPRAFALSDGTSSNVIEVHGDSASSTPATGWYAYSAVDGVIYVVNANIPSSAGATKLGISYDTNDVAYNANGNAPGTDTSATLPGGLTTLSIGVQASGTSNQLNGHVKRVALYSYAASDAELQSLTAS